MVGNEEPIFGIMIIKFVNEYCTNDKPFLIRTRDLDPAWKKKISSDMCWAHTKHASFRHVTRLSPQEYNSHEAAKTACPRGCYRKFDTDSNCYDMVTAEKCNVDKWYKEPLEIDHAPKTS